MQQATQREAGFAAVILAAGCGSRAGGYKPLWKIGDRFVIDLVIEAAETVCSRVRVVGGYAFERLEAHVEKLAKSRVELLRNENWKKGMFSSLKKGLVGIKSPVFVHPSDICGVTPEVYIKLAEAIRNGPEECVARPLYGKRTGHPILLMPAVVKAVLAAPFDSNLRVVLSNFKLRHDVPVDDPLILRDFDTELEFKELAEQIITRRNSDYDAIPSRIDHI